MAESKQVIKMWTEEQQTIIYGSAENRVVYAAPGSGKTSVLTEHIAQLLRSGYPASRLMAVTFTRQAAMELRHRLGQNGLPSKVVESVRLGTFHAQVFRWLLSLYPDIPVLLRQAEQRALVQTTCEQLGFKSAVDDVMLRLGTVRSSWPMASVDRTFRRLLATYESLKTKHHRWDFDDILIRCCELLSSSSHDWLPEVDYLLVDEFQDTNQCQWYILQKLQEIRSTRLFVVGDDDQAIYGFRGGDPTWLVDFPKRVSNTCVNTLSTNFRSHMRIVSVASSLIQNNKRRFPKSTSPASRETGQVLCVVHQTANHQYRWILTDVHSRMFDDAQQGEGNEKGVSRPFSVAVLARTRRQLMDFYRYYTRTWRERSGPGLEFRTFHDAKGREWDEVHLLDSVNLQSGSDIEEERRLFFVGMTRAKQRLCVHVPLWRDGKRTKVVPFVQESGLHMVEVPLPIISDFQPYPR